MAAPLHWDLFCRVVDNYGDIGFGWRLAADLAGRGDRVRLWVDDASALAWMAPGGASGVQVLPFDTAGQPTAATAAEVVVELFGCDPPRSFVTAMAARARPPLWINLEHLSAETWVERAHGLPSPHASGLTKWFWFPGFTPNTGGLLREPGLALPATQPVADRAASVFCYPNPALPALARDWHGPLKLCPGPAQADPALRGERLPWLTQPGYDALLRGCAVNFVRGEDSIVRAIWAGRPFVWQIYPQHDGVHRIKLDAFLARLLEGTGDEFARALTTLWHAWNGFAGWPAPAHWPDMAAWSQACLRWRDRLLAQTDLVGQLRRFVLERR